MAEPINENRRKQIMDNAPLVSAIIIFLNEEKYLEDAVQSVIRQTYANWELLLVDDGSTDKSIAIALSYAISFPDKIKYLEHEGHQNKGMSATRNLGINHAKGDYIGFLDADDIWLSDKLTDQMEIFRKHPECGMVYGRTEIWHSWTGNIKDANIDYFYPLGLQPNSVVYPPKIALLLLENKAQSPTTCNALFKKKVFEKVGFFIEDFRGMFEDAAFFSKVGLHFPTYVSDKVWARYRQHPNSSSHIIEKNDQIYKARLNYLEWFEQYIIEKGADKDKDLWKAFKCAMRPFKYKNLSKIISFKNRIVNKLRRSLVTQFR